jgi:hypothetical protein
MKTLTPEQRKQAAAGALVLAALMAAFAFDLHQPVVGVVSDVLGWPSPSQEPVAGGPDGGVDLSGAAEAPVGFGEQSAVEGEQALGTGEAAEAAAVLMRALDGQVDELEVLPNLVAEPAWKALQRIEDWYGQPEEPTTEQILSYFSHEKLWVRLATLQFVLAHESVHATNGFLIDSMSSRFVRGEHPSQVRRFLERARSKDLALYNKMAALLRQDTSRPAPAEPQESPGPAEAEEGAQKCLPIDEDCASIPENDVGELMDHVPGMKEIVLGSAEEYAKYSLGGRCGGDGTLNGASSREPEFDVRRSDVKRFRLWTTGHDLRETILFEKDGKKRFAVYEHTGCDHQSYLRVVVTDDVFELGDTKLALERAFAEWNQLAGTNQKLSNDQFAYDPKECVAEINVPTGSVAKIDCSGGELTIRRLSEKFVAIRHEYMFVL